MSDIVEIRSSSNGAWQQIVLNAPPGNLLSLELVRALGKALHSLESTRGIKWLTIEGAAGEWFDTHLSPHSAVALAHAVSAARLTLRAQAEPALDAAERDYLGGLLKTHDAVEGVQAWINKRAPNWKNS